MVLRSSLQHEKLFEINLIAAGGIASLGKKKKLSKLGPMMEKKIVPVETDAQKLVNYVCGSNLLKGGEDIKVKPDDEYPDWLWTLRIGERKLATCWAENFPLYHHIQNFHGTVLKQRDITFTSRLY
jgi:hypothetical protein